jgi:hypothetical protein
MNELKPEDVMMDLECCGYATGCTDCILATYDGSPCAVKKALALLREKDARIEQLLADIRATVEVANKGAAEKDAEIERLTAYIQRCKSGEEYWVKCLLERPQEARADAIDEFEQSLREDIILNGAFGFEYTSHRDEALESISKIAKELKGEKE